MRLLVVASVLVSVACGPSIPIAKGPPMPLPVAEVPVVPPPWHRVVIGTTVRGVSAARKQDEKVGLWCYGDGQPAGPDSVNGWAQIDNVDGSTGLATLSAGDDPMVCVYHPVANAPRRALVRPRALPTGVLEGEVWSFPAGGAPQRDAKSAAFMLPDGVVIVARNGAIPLARAELSARVPRLTPLALAPDLLRWSYSSDFSSLEWMQQDDVLKSYFRLRSESDARDFVVALVKLDVMMAERHIGAPRSSQMWVNGADVYRISRPK